MAEGRHTQRSVTTSVLLVGRDERFERKLKKLAETRERQRKYEKEQKMKNRMELLELFEGQTSALVEAYKNIISMVKEMEIERRLEVEAAKECHIALVNALQELDVNCKYCEHLEDRPSECDVACCLYCDLACPCKHCNNRQLYEFKWEKQNEEKEKVMDRGKM